MIADDIADALVSRLSSILTTGGYATDLGQRVFEGKRAISGEQVPCVVIYEGDEKIDAGTRRNFKNVTEYVLEGFSTCDPEHPNRRARAIVADIKRAVFTGDITLGGISPKIEYSGRVIGENPAGTTYVSGRVGIRITFPDNMLAT